MYENNIRKEFLKNNKRIFFKEVSGKFSSPETFLIYRSGARPGLCRTYFLPDNSFCSL
jgi:hypothetical protein